MDKHANSDGVATAGTVAPDLVERITWRDLFTVPDGAEPPSQEDQAKLDAYLHAFAKPRQRDGHVLCLGCGAQMRGGIDGFLLGGAPGNATWEWSLAHGECHCSQCGYPARAYHFNIGGDGDDAIIRRLSLTLQYHPDFVRRSESPQADPAVVTHR